MGSFNCNIHKASRPHGCLLCLKAINKGERYYRGQMPGSTKALTHAFHLDCYRKAAQASAQAGEGSGDG